MIIPLNIISSRNEGAITTLQKYIANEDMSVGGDKSGIIGFTKKVDSSINEIAWYIRPPITETPRQQNIAGINSDGLTGRSGTATLTGILIQYIIIAQAPTNAAEKEIKEAISYTISNCSRIYLSGKNLAAIKKTMNMIPYLNTYRSNSPPAAALEFFLNSLRSGLPSYLKRIYSFSL